MLLSMNFSLLLSAEVNGGCGLDAKLASDGSKAGKDTNRNLGLLLRPIQKTAFYRIFCVQLDARSAVDLPRHRRAFAHRHDPMPMPCGLHAAWADSYIYNI
jgi:hypothetical protein